VNEIIIVRHGETRENKSGICQGHTEGTLSGHGIKQNILLAEQLKTYKIHKIYSSPLIRAFETGKEIWKYHKDIELQKDFRLIEWNMGVLQGHKFPRGFDVFGSYKGMENPKQVEMRVRSFLDEIMPLHNKQNILFISHGLTIKVITTILMNKPVENIHSIKLMENSSFSVFCSDNNKGFKLKK